LCDVPFDSNDMTLVSISGEGENRYVTSCISIRETGEIKNPGSVDDIVDLPSDIYELISYLDEYYDNYDSHCPSRTYERDEQQQLFDHMLECSTFHTYGESEPWSDPCAGTVSEEEWEACMEALGE
jgi:hypothetical protein